MPDPKETNQENQPIIQTPTDNNQNIAEPKKVENEDFFAKMMQRLDAIEKNLQTKQEPKPDSTPANGEKKGYSEEEVEALLKKREEGLLNGMKKIIDDKEASRKLEDMMRQIPPEHYETAKLITEFVKDPNEAIKQITERKLLIPTMLDYNTAISSGKMTKEQILSKIPLLENMGITEQNLGFNFKDLVTMVALRKFIDGANVVDNAYKTLKEKFKLK